MAATSGDPFELAVKLSVKGVAESVKEFRAAQEQWVKHVREMAEAVNKAGAVMEGTFRKAALFVGGFVAAGVAASAMGQVFGYQMGELSREIASLFLPELQKATELLQSLLEWFRNLSGEQQRAIAHWVELGLGVLAFGVVVPKVTALLGSLASAIKIVGLNLAALTAHPIVALATAVAAVLVVSLNWKKIIEAVGRIFEGLAPKLEPLFAAFGRLFAALGRLLEPLSDAFIKALEAAAVAIGKAADALTFVVDRIADGLERLQGVADKVLGEKGSTRREALGKALDAFKFVSSPTGFLLGKALEGSSAPAAKRDEPHKTVPPRLGGFESLDAAYQRIAVASIKATAGKSLGEQQLDVQKIIQAVTESIRDLLASPAPGVA